MDFCVLSPLSDFLLLLFPAYSGVAKASAVQRNLLLIISSSGVQRTLPSGKGYEEGSLPLAATTCHLVVLTCAYRSNYLWESTASAVQGKNHAQVFIVVVAVQMQNESANMLCQKPPQSS